MPKPVFTVVPMAKQRTPRYPGLADTVCVADALRDSIWRAFSARTIALAALFAGGVGSTASPTRAADDEKKAPIKVDMDKVQEIVKKYLGKELTDNEQENEAIPDGAAYVERLRQTPAPLASNPDYFVGVEELVNEKDVAPLRGIVALTAVHEQELLRAAKELFALYGIDLKDNTPFDSGKAVFEADGFDKTKNIGIELASSMPDYNVFDGTQWVQVKESDEQFLSQEEIQELDTLVKKNKANVLVLPRESYTQQGVSEFIIKKAFLRSVLDYLEWLRTSGRL